MATTNYMPRGGRDNDPARVQKSAQKLAPGHAPELQPRPGAENRTPAPTRVYDPTAKDRTWGRESGNPGGNAYSGASSLSPGQKAPPATIDPHGPGGADPVLKNLAMGVKRAIDGDDNWQQRDLNDAGDRNRGRVPTHPNMTGPSPGGTVPAKCGPNK